MSKSGFKQLDFESLTDEESLERAKVFEAQLRKRRTVREYSSRAVDKQLIDHCLLAAGSAPSGANLQPWHFVVVSNPKVKATIREAAEEEEREFYEHRAPQTWLDKLAPLGTDANKPFLETAPYLIVIFAQQYELATDGSTEKNYYVSESVGIATGMLITALHQAGLATLTHTPSPMGFLNKILDRPKNERAYLILVVGHPSQDAMVPNIEKKPLDEIATWV